MDFEMFKPDSASKTGYLLAIVMILLLPACCITWTLMNPDAFKFISKQQAEEMRRQAEQRSLEEQRKAVGFNPDLEASSLSLYTDEHGQRVVSGQVTNRSGYDYASVRIYYYLISQNGSKTLDGVFVGDIKQHESEKFRGYIKTGNAVEVVAAGTSGNMTN